jgi:hypothetical protein
MTLPNVSIKKDTWTDLYAESGATAGTALIAQNLCTHTLKISYSDTQPADLSSYFHARPGEIISNEIGDGFWVFSHIAATIAVAEG